MRFTRFKINYLIRSLKRKRYGQINGAVERWMVNVVTMDVMFESIDIVDICKQL